MLTLGIDTGGTYTDAVLLDPAARRIVAKTKVFTTKHNLASCIDDSLRAFSSEMLGRVSLVSLSTTLATNSLVEGTTGRVGLVVMGRLPEGPLPVAVWRHIGGLLDIKGRVIHPVDPEEVARTVAEIAGGVDAMAVSGFASVRNPAHELAVRDTIRRTVDLPVVCGHELSSALGHNDRTVTAVINAGLISKIEALVQAVRDIMAARRIEAPIMVVRGDGSLIRDDAALSRPIETILSGPAASIVGGLYLSGRADALLVDMGGTTTDIAHARDGTVAINPNGAMVGGWRTMVRAAEIATFGIGGDSRIAPGAEPGSVEIGPRRVTPFSVAGSAEPGIAQSLARAASQPAGEICLASQGTFYRLVADPGPGAAAIESAVAAALRGGPLSAGDIAMRLATGVAHLPLDSMCRNAMVEAISLTPTDILHASGELTLWDAEAARAGALLFSKKMELDLDEFLEKVRSDITDALAVACLDSAVRFSGGGEIGTAALRHLVGTASGDDENDIVATRFSLKKEIVAVGAPVGAWLPAVGNFFTTPVVIPEHAEVANAVGAAVGQVRVAVRALVRPDRERKVYRAHAPGAAQEFASRGEAEEWALEQALRAARDRILEWGGVNAAVTERIDPRHVVDGDGTPRYIETTISVEAAGNPSAIHGESGHIENFGKRQPLS
ncbi:MAG: hydantoinase/oxoprolinase family protein [Planctomycetes bacterium]|nr:hydantoinase/oxoprolinase family protein [Planctomycetota bacterium]